MPSTMYAIHSMVRSRFNRTQRAAAPVHHRFKQYVCKAQHRLVRGRALLISEEELKDNLAELRAKAAMGVIEVRLAIGGQKVNLETLEAAPLPAPAPLPHPPLDSVANDKQNVGQPMPTFSGGDQLPPPPTPMPGELEASAEVVDEELEAGPPVPPLPVADEEEVEHVEVSSKKKGRR